MRVFIADDSLAVIERLHELLSSLPWIEVAGYAKDAPQALRLIHDIKPCVVILDVHLPSGSGLDLLREVKSQFPETILVVLTNCVLPQYREKCAEAGADAFLDKSSQFADIPYLLQRLRKREGYIRPAPCTIATKSGSKVKIGW